MNVYDFDKTIYVDDCATDFYKYSIKKNPGLALKWPKLISAYVKFRLKKISRTKLKEVLYQYVIENKNLENDVKNFWSKHEYKIQDWYLSQRQEDDLIISASPEFLIEPISKQLGVAFIASRLNPKTGLYDGLNCYGDEKVVRFYDEYPDAHVHEFYSDSLSDTPMARLADRAYFVKGTQITPWPKDVLDSDTKFD